MQPIRTTRQRELLDDLVELILAEGFRHLTLETLARRLHCSRSTLYAFGHSKEEVIVNTVKRFFRTGTEYVELRTAEADDPIDRIVTYLTAVSESLRAGSQEFFTDLIAHPRTRAIYELNTEAAAGRIRQFIAEGINTGSFRDVHATFVAEVTAATMARIPTGELMEHVNLSVPQAYAELATLIVGGIRSGPSLSVDAG